MTRYLPVPRHADKWVERNNVRDLARQTVETKVRELRPSAKDGWTIYTGLAGQAYLYWLLARPTLRRPGSARDACLRRARNGIRDCLADQRGLNESRCCTFLCGAVGVWALAAVILGESHYADQVLAWQTRALETDSNELLYGKAGYIAALLFVRDHADFGWALRHRRRRNGNDRTTTPPGGQSAEDRLGPNLATALANAIQTVGKRILSAGHEAGRSNGHHDDDDHLRWTWHDKEYLGLHGTAAILSVLLSAGFRDAAIWQTVDWLHRQRLNNGNYPTQPEPRKPQVLAQFCHGATGIGLLFAQCARIGPSGRRRSTYLAWAQECAEFLTREGFLKKGISLCHGSCGNAFLFMHLYHQTRDNKWLRWAQKYGLLLALERNKPLWSQADEPYCLANGLAGAIYFYSVLGSITDDANTSPDFPLLPLP